VHDVGVRMIAREVTLFSIFLRITAAVILGGSIGIERGLKNRPAGLRTYMLVCVGSCLVMLTNQYIYQIYGTGDPVLMGRRWSAESAFWVLARLL